jgi:hypothetical protein
MEWRIIYLGARGGGSQLTEALLQCFDGHSKGIVSERNQEIVNKNVIRISKVPHGLLENLIFPFKFKVKSRIMEQVLDELRGHKSIFVMSHPVDKFIKRRINQTRYWTVIHDVIKHKGDFWPSNRIIKEIVDKNSNLIFLSEHVRSASLRKFSKGGIVLPLISPQRSVVNWENRVFDVAILGRHRKYKTLDVGLQVLSSIETPMSIFL